MEPHFLGCSCPPPGVSWAQTSMPTTEFRGGSSGPCWGRGCQGAHLWSSYSRKGLTLRRSDITTPNPWAFENVECDSDRCNWPLQQERQGNHLAYFQVRQFI